ncbi:MAG TPA: hypothetical protein VN372_03755 [Methanospirillum sp.]|nr:hypothetical protein [Methanospirillum sp.]
MHGGAISDTIVETIFDFISDAENQAGSTDYRKGFIKNFGETPTGICNIRPGLVMPNALVDRLGVTIALGTASDDMTTKPDDSAFSSVLNTEISPGSSIPVWLKRTILAGGSEPGSYLGIQLVLTVSET